MDLVFKHTPIEKYMLNDNPVWVKREDLCCLSKGAPPFSKMRGISPALRQMMNDNNIHVFGYVETPISMAGWGISWVCKAIGAHCVIFDPQYKTDHPVHSVHRKYWKRLGAEIIPIPAGMARVSYNICRKTLLTNYKDSFMLPLGMPMEQSIKATAEELQHTLTQFTPGCIVTVIGSGTIGAGILRACGDIPVYGVVCRNMDIARKRNVIEKKAGRCIGGLTGGKFHLINTEWEYMEPYPSPIPFPCHPYYDAKAWNWLVENLQSLPSPVLFWNIGAPAV